MPGRAAIQEAKSPPAVLAELQLGARRAGGCGKTRLALQVAAEWLDGSGDGWRTGVNETQTETSSLRLDAGAGAGGSFGGGGGFEGVLGGGARRAGGRARRGCG